jgi:hypothetical protein
MGEIVKLYIDRVEKMSLELKAKIAATPVWQLDNSLPIEVKSLTTEEKINYVVNKNKNTNPLFVILFDDIDLLNKNDQKISSKDLKALSLDPRFLEGLGLNEKQIAEYNAFVNKINSLI